MSPAHSSRTDEEEQNDREESDGDGLFVQRHDRDAAPTSEVLRAIREAREQLRNHPDMSIEDVLAARTLVAQMDGILDERLRARMSRSPEL